MVPCLDIMYTPNNILNVVPLVANLSVSNSENFVSSSLILPGLELESYNTIMLAAFIAVNNWGSVTNVSRLMKPFTILLSNIGEKHRL